MSCALQCRVFTPVIAVLLMASSGCAFRAAVREGRHLVAEGQPDAALALLHPFGFKVHRRSDRLQARFHFVKGTALYEIGHDATARTALHVARSADLRARSGLKDDDRIVLAGMIGELDSVAAGEVSPAVKETAEGTGSTGKPPGELGKPAPPEDAEESPGSTPPRAASAKPVGDADPEAAIVIECSRAVNTPTDVYEGYVWAMDAHDAECVLEHFTDTFRESLVKMLEFVLDKLTAFEGEVLEETIDGEEATLHVRERITLDIGGKEFTSEREKKLPMEKERGVWKLASLGAAAAAD